MRGEAKRLAGFPGERLGFRAWPDHSRSADDVEWSGGGTPARARGPSFRTSFDRSGRHTVRAACEEASVEFVVTICPIDDWLADARGFFGPSLDFSSIRVGTSRLILGRSGAGFTCNQVIRFKRPRREEDLPSESTFIHELGHVWQHQSGRAQLLRGFVEQVGKRLGRDPYDFGGPDGVREAGSLTSFSLESQAQILQELWKGRHGARTDARGNAFSTTGYVDGLQRLADGAGIGVKASPRGRTVASTVDGFVARIVNAVVDQVG
jgi:hypothetical protein